MESIPRHNELINEILDTKILTKTFVSRILDKYDIDINYNNSMILLLVLPCQEPDIVAYQNVNLLLSMGADPNLIMDDDILCFETSFYIKIYLDAIFQSYGYKCLWEGSTTGSIIDIEKILIDLDLDERVECYNAKNNNDNTAKVRYFKLCLNGSYHGRFSGNTPLEAATKAFTKIMQENNQNTEIETIIEIKESTRGSNHQTYKFNAKRIKLDVPLEYTIRDAETGNDEILTYNYKNHLEEINS